jgi:hypothetical protein
MEKLSNHFRQRPRFWALLLVAACLAVYWPALTNGFVGYDDNWYIYENPQIPQGMRGPLLRGRLRPRFTPIGIRSHGFPMPLMLNASD